MKSIFIAAIVAAACSGVAMAGEVKQNQKIAAPAVKGQVMSDSEMDRITAGQPGFGVFTALDQPSNAVRAFSGLGAHAVEQVPSGIAPGCGTQTVTNCPSH